MEMEMIKSEITEKTFRDAFEKYLHSLKATEIHQNSDGVDLVATINGDKKYFELKTCKKDENDLKEDGYFGAITMVEWQCALSHPDDFYLVLVWHNPNDTNDTYHFRPIKLKDIFQYSRIEPFATYLNIPIGNNCIKDFLEFNVEEQKVPVFKQILDKGNSVFPVMKDIEEKRNENKLKKCKKEEPSTVIDEKEIWSFSSFYYHKKIKAHINGCENGSAILYIIPSNEVENLRKNGIKRGTKIEVYLCNDIRKYPFENGNSYAIIKLDKNDLYIEDERINEVCFANVRKKINITLKNIIERYFRN
jgi:hypothetical protein